MKLFLGRVGGGLAEFEMDRWLVRRMPREGEGSLGQDDGNLRSPRACGGPPW